MGRHVRVKKNILKKKGQKGEEEEKKKGHIKEMVKRHYHVVEDK